MWTGMPGQGHGLQLEETAPRRLRSLGNAKDVFVMVKLSMSDRELAQPPLLCYTESLLPLTETFFNMVNQTTDVLTACLEETRAEELVELASVMERDFPHLTRGARYLKQLANDGRQRAPYSTLGFIAAGPSAALGVGHVQLGRPAPPPKPYKLQVVFHHRQR